MNYIKQLIAKFKAWRTRRKRIQELKKRDPFIYK